MEKTKHRKLQSFFSMLFPFLFFSSSELLWLPKVHTSKIKVISTLYHVIRFETIHSGSFFRFLNKEIDSKEYRMFCDLIHISAVWG